MGASSSQIDRSVQQPERSPSASSEINGTAGDQLVQDLINATPDPSRSLDVLPMAKHGMQIERLHGEDSLGSERKSRQRKLGLAQIQDDSSGVIDLWNSPKANVRTGYNQETQPSEQRECSVDDAKAMDITLEKGLRKAEETLATYKKDRKEVQRKLKRAAMENVVESNAGFWRQTSSGKWGVKMYKEGEAPDKGPLTSTQVKAATLRENQLESLREEEQTAFAKEEDARLCLNRMLATCNEKGSVPEQVHLSKSQGQDAVKTQDVPLEKQRKRQKLQALAAFDGRTQSGDHGNSKTSQVALNPSGQHISAYGTENHIRDWLNDNGNHSPNQRPREDKLPVSRKRKLLHQRNVHDDQNEINSSLHSANSSKPLLASLIKSANEGHSRQTVTAGELPTRKTVGPKRSKKSANQEIHTPESQNLVRHDVLPTPASEVVQSQELNLVTQKEKHGTPVLSNAVPDSNETLHLPAAKTKRPIPAVSSGPFTHEEREITDQIFNEILVRNNYTAAELKAKLKPYRNAGDFKTELEAALPNRSKDAIRKFVQRRYHQHERGPWTTEQDEALRTAHAKWPDQWAKISELVDRTADDCRDRWRKVLGDNKVTGPWSEEEETALLEAVAEIKEMITKEREKAGDDYFGDDVEALIAWTVISDKLDNKRLGKQCREKYHKLKARQPRVDGVADARGTTTDRSCSPEANSFKPNPRSKLARAKRYISSFELGDYYDVFTEIYKTFPYVSANFNDYNDVWMAVSWKNQSSRFNNTGMGGALRRAAFETAINDWPENSIPKRVRRKLVKVRSAPAQALVLARWIEKTAGVPTEKLERGYKTELVDKPKKEILKINQEDKASRKAKAAAVKAKKAAKAEKMLSKDYVTDSEESDVERVSGRPRSHSNNSDQGAHDSLGDQDEDEEDLPSPLSSDSEPDIGVLNNVKLDVGVKTDFSSNVRPMAQPAAGQHQEHDDNSKQERVDSQPLQMTITNAARVIPDSQLEHSPDMRRASDDRPENESPEQSSKSAHKLNPNDFLQRCRPTKGKLRTPSNRKPKPITYSRNHARDRIQS